VPREQADAKPPVPLFVQNGKYRECVDPELRDDIRLPSPFKAAVVTMRIVPAQDLVLPGVGALENKMPPPALVQTERDILGVRAE